MTAPPDRRGIDGALIVLVCFVAAGLSLIWARQPSFDPWSWLVWGREMSGTSLSGFDTGGPSGWKPLPVFVSLPFNWLGGDAAPIAWLWLQRTAMLLIPFAAFRAGRVAAGALGGAASFAATLLIPGVFIYVGGLSEPVVGLGLLMTAVWACEEREGRAWIAGMVATAGRPEALAAVLPWGCYASARRRLYWGWVMLGTLLSTLLWMIGDWISKGKPLALLGKADKGAEPLSIQRSDHPGLELLSRIDASLLVVGIAAAAFVAGWIWRDRISRLLGLFVLAVGGSIAVATEFGYPGVSRYVTPVEPMLYALAGIGIARLAGLAGRTWARWTVAAVLVGALFALVGPAALRSDQSTLNWYRERVRDESRLSAIIAAAGGRGAALSCGAYTVDPPAEGSALAWKLDVMTKQVARGGIEDLHTWSPPTLIYVADRRRATFGEQVAERKLAWKQVARTPGWTAFAVAPTAAQLCRV